MASRLKSVCVSALAIGTALALTACGNDGAAGNGTNDSALTTTEPAVAAPAETKTASDEYEWPIFEYLGLVLGVNSGLTPAEELQRAVAQNVQREDLIAECMHGYGFEFTPFVERNPLPIYGGEPWRRDDPEWVAQWGYGFQNPNPEPGSIPFRSIRAGELDPDDPNNDVLAHMTELETRAWNLAFWGFQGDAGWSAADWQELFQEAWESNPGCLEISEQQIRDTQPISVFINEFRPLFDAYNAALVFLPSTIPDYEQDWSNCMANAGHPGFARHMDASTSISMAMQTWSAELGQWVTPDDAALAELRDREIELALTDLNCRVATDYNSRRDDALRERQIQFINDNHAALVALRDAAEQSGLNW